MNRQGKKRVRPFEPKSVAESAKQLYDLLKQFNNDRYQSWEHCYLAFHEAFELCNAGKRAKVDVDKLCLHLAFYLASWGMYRGSAFLLRCDYKVHEKIVRRLLKHADLHGLECKGLLQGKLNELCELYRKIKKSYEPYCKDVQERQKIWNAKYDKSKKENQREFNGATPTLVTKILMGTLGCVPAFDRYVVSQLGLYGLRQSVRQPMELGGYRDVVSQLARQYEDNESLFEPVRETMKMGKVLYPQMKLLDMGLLGLSLKQENT